MIPLWNFNSKALIPSTLSYIHHHISEKLVEFEFKLQMLVKEPGYFFNAPGQRYEVT